MSLRIGDLTVLNVLIWKAFVQSYIEKTVSSLIFAHLCSLFPHLNAPLKVRRDGNELQAIIEAVDLYETLPILEQAKGLVIFCDSTVALQAILNRGSRITEEICSRLFRLQELEKQKICNISEDRLITKTITTLRTDHYRVMKFDSDGRRSYRNCDNCLDTELTPAHTFDCSAILATLQEIGVLFSSTNLYEDNIEQIARTVI
ncbi:uncharacterized protein TNCV_700981 [Trichonephila clavipes]|nr:uncharacterized protein TNCV_700981 [Trichonephila clavipes]